MDISIIFYAMEEAHRIPRGEIDNLKLFNQLGYHHDHIIFKIHLSS
jgi:hypothetical protein